MMPGENENILIRVVDDDAHMRGSLEFMLTAEGFAVKTYPSAQAFLTDDAPSRPGCLILDVKMDGMTGLELQEEMIRRGIRLPVVFLSAHGDIDMAVDTMQRGAVAFVQKTADPSRLMEAVYKAVARWNTLTPKEKDVAKLLAKGLLNREVGIRLGGISVKTVQVHRSEINRKLGVKGVVELTEAVNRIRALLGEAAA